MQQTLHTLIEKERENEQLKTHLNLVWEYGLIQVFMSHFIMTLEKTWAKCGQLSYH